MDFISFYLVISICVFLVLFYFVKPLKWQGWMILIAAALLWPLTATAIIAITLGDYYED